MQDQVTNAMESAREAAATVGERVSDFFQGNPFATPCGRKVEMATDASILATENWGLNMEICDFINNTPEGGRDAIRAIRKRLHTQMSKNNAIVMYTLTVLETCVKNCDITFHELVCQKDFINELVKLIGPKFDAPQIIQERVLSLIQSWNDAFRGEPRLQGVCQVYEELKAKGVEFPMTNLDNMAPIITPKRTVFSTPTDRLTDSNFSHAVPQNILDPSQHVRPTSKQLEKLRKELDIVNNNLKVLREMLSELAPGKEQPDDMELLVELHAVCKQMQQRILDLIRSIVNEEVTYELLILNDEFNNVFEKYDRYMSNRSSGNKASDSQLVDTEEQRFNEQLEAMHITNARHTRQSTETIYAENSTRLDQAKIGLAKAAFNKSALMSDREADEISQWLEAQETKCNPTVRNPDVPTEFDPLIKKDDKNDGL